METSIIVDGFLQDEKLYGVRYNKKIANGDSSVYKKILEMRPYKNLNVLKIECRNIYYEIFEINLKLKSSDQDFYANVRKHIKIV